MNIVDSCGWLEYFADGPNAQFFATPIETPTKLVVPTVTLTEVFKRVLQQRDEDSALAAVALMSQGRVVDLDTATALRAARIGHDHHLPLADSIILATARLHNATLFTQDADFKGLPGVKFVDKKKRV